MRLFSYLNASVCVKGEDTQTIYSFHRTTNTGYQFTSMDCCGAIPNTHLLATVRPLLHGGHRHEHVDLLLL